MHPCQSNRVVKFEILRWPPIARFSGVDHGQNTRFLPHRIPPPTLQIARKLGVPLLKPGVATLDTLRPPEPRRRVSHCSAGLVIVLLGVRHKNAEFFRPIGREKVRALYLQ